MPPSAADGGSYDERNDGGNTENRCSDLPTVGPLLLLDGEMLLSIQTLLFLGQLLFDLLATFLFSGNVAEQGIDVLRSGKKHRGHAHDADESFHMWVPFLEMGTKNPAPFENRKLCWG